MKYVVLMGALAAVAAVPAQAQDFSGFRIEARGGWDQVDVKASYPNPDDDEDEEGDEFLTASGDDSSVSYGIELGYDVQFGGGMVLGPYAGLDYSDGRNCAELIGEDLTCAELGRNFTIGARAGIPLGESLLLYAKGGYSNGKFEASYDSDVTDNDDDEPGAIEEFKESFDGYHVGGGAELALASGIYAKVEYVYTDYGNRSYLLADGDPGDPALSVDPGRHQALVGLGIRF